MFLQINGRFTNGKFKSLLSKCFADHTIVHTGTRPGLVTQLQAHIHTETMKAPETMPILTKTVPCQDYTMYTSLKDSLRKLLNQGFLLVKLKSSLRKIYGRYHDLVDRYGIYVSLMTTDMFHLS